MQQLAPFRSAPSLMFPFPFHPYSESAFQPTALHPITQTLAPSLTLGQLFLLALYLW